MGVKRIGLDVGTYSVKVCAGHTDAVREVPCAAAVDTLTGRLLACGERVYPMIGRTPKSFEIRNFMKNGAINDFALAKQVLGEIVDRLMGQRVLRPVLVACVSVGITELEKKTLLDVLYDVGASKAMLVYSPVASAIGHYGVEPTPEGRAVLDIGAGAADCAVVTMNGVAVRKAAPEGGGDAMTRAMVRYLAERRDLIVGESEAERLKKELACVYPRAAELAFVAGGKKVSGESVSFELSSTEVSHALRPCFEQARQLVVSVLDETSPELVGDIKKTGVLLTGGCASIPGFDRYLSKTLGVPVTVPERPSFCTVEGVKKILPRIRDAQQAGIVSEVR